MAAPRPAVTAEAPPRWEVILAWILRVIIGGTAVAHFVLGDWIYGVLCVAALGVILGLALLARPRHASPPIEIELVFMIFLVGDTTLGNLLHLYDRISWFDKVMHVNNSILLGFLAFLFVYALHFTGQLRTSAWVNGAAILLLTLGVGALWEISEYLTDVFFAIRAQGSPGMTPIDDTMWDLILDGLGGLAGAVFGSLYMRYSRRNRRRRIDRIVEALGSRLGPEQGPTTPTLAPPARRPGMPQTNGHGKRAPRGGAR